MKLSCTKDNLHQALSITSHLTSKNVNLPILQNVLVKAEGGTIKFTSTNLEIAVDCVVRGKVEEEGEFTVPSKLFFDYVSLLPNEPVHLEVIENSLFVSSGSNQTKINGIEATDFPLVPKIEAPRVYKIPVEDFRKALSRVVFAVATNESRPELTGVSMQFTKGAGESILTLAATDSYRLAECSIAVVTPVEQDEALIVPQKTLTEIGRIVSVFKDDVEAPTTVEMGISDNQIVFRYGSVELTSRIIEGNYPDYKQIIPTEFQTDTVLDKQDFIKAVKTASLFSRNGLFDVTLDLFPEKNELAIRALDSGRGENTASLTTPINGQSNSVTVNFRYLLDGLNTIDSDQVSFKMIDAGNPCVVQPKDGTVSYTYIVMPIKQ